MSARRRRSTFQGVSFAARRVYRRVYQSGEPVVQGSAVHYLEGGSADDRDGIRALQRGYDTQRNGPERPPGGGNGLYYRLDLGPLPPLDRRAGREPVRVERDRR